MWLILMLNNLFLFCFYLYMSVIWSSLKENASEFKLCKPPSSFVEEVDASW